MELKPGAKLGPYEIVSAIGKGGMGEVWKARDPRLNRDVAIKISTRQFSDRFEREAQAIAALNHPNICILHDIGPDYLVMEYIEGATLAERIKRGSIPLEEAIGIARQIADALEAAHEKSIVHRDLKPANIKIRPDGSVKVLDFGLAKAGGSVEVTPDSPTALTLTGVILGTAGYMAPEQARGKHVDKRADIWAFGVVLYEMVTGQKLFQGETPSDSLAAVLTREPDWDRVPERLQRVLRLCLEKNLRRRLRDIGDARHLLDTEAGTTASVATARRTPGWSRREWLIAGPATGVCVCGAIGYWTWSHAPYRPKPSSIEWYSRGVRALHSTTYESARKALEQAVSNDPGFALAHASLAQAYDELDYTERAKESMLRAVTLAADTRLSQPDQRRLRTFQLMISRDYERAAILLAQMESAASPAEKPAAALEYGWLAQRRDRTAEAAEAYERALKLDPSYAPARLRLGYMLNREGHLDPAQKSFQEAERLYQASSDYEGVSEAEIGQANLLIRSNRAAAAMPLIEKALATASTIGSSYLAIRLELLQGVAYRSLGEADRAGEIARRAIDAADAQHMDNLASSALVDLGNSYLVRRKPAEAEPIYLRALDVARRGGVPRHEARALLALASICEQSRRPDEARRYIEASLPFYREGGYRREVIQATIMLGSVLSQQAQYEDSIHVLQSVLSDAVQLRDPILEAQVRERLAGALRDQGDWPAALAETETAATLFGLTDQSFDLRVNGARIRWKLGRRAETASSLMEVERLLQRNPSPQSSFDLTILKSEMSYEDSRLSDAAALARQALTLPGAAEEARPGASVLLSLVLIRGHREAEGLKMASPALDAFDRVHLTLEAAEARLSLAEALADAGQIGPASAYALKALEFFEPRRILEAVWRAHAAAARAAGPEESAPHREAARAALDKLKSSWPAGDVASYLERPNIRAASGKL